MKKDLENNPEELRKFGIVLGLILGVIGFFQWRHGRIPATYTLWSLALVAELLALAAPLFLKPVFKGFMKIALVIGWVNTRLLLILIFYLIALPIGFTMRLFGKDLLNRKIDKAAKSYWVDHPEKPLGRKHYEKQF